FRRRCLLILATVTPSLGGFGERQLPIIRRLSDTCRRNHPSDRRGGRIHRPQREDPRWGYPDPYSAGGPQPDSRIQRTEGLPASGCWCLLRCSSFEFSVSIL